MLHTWILPLSEKVKDAIDANHVSGTKQKTGGVSRLDGKGMGDIDCQGDGGDMECCFKHLSILSLYVFFSLGSRTVKGTEGGNRTHRDGSPIAHLLWQSVFSVQPPGCSQGTPIPSLFLSSVSIGVVLLASG